MGPEGPIAAVPGAGAVSGYNSEMICSATTQAANVGIDVLVRVSGLGLEESSRSILGGGSILELDVRGQPVWIKRAVEHR